jgi:multiple sugar transport system permease protein
MEGEVTEVVKNTEQPLEGPALFGRWFANFLVYGSLLLGVLVMVFPFVWMVGTSLKTETEVFTFNLQILPKGEWNWSNYVTAVTILPFARFYVNSMVVATAVTIGQVVTSALAAYAFARLNWPGRDRLFLFYLAALMIPGQITLVPRFILMRSFGWIDTYAALIVPQMFSVFGTFLLRQFFLSIPRELEDAARIDGASHPQIWYRIILPLSRSALSTLAIFTFLGSWNELLWPLVMTNSANMKTVPIGLLSFQGQFTTNWPVMMAAASLAVVPVLVVYMFGQKQLVEGISTTGFGGL